MKSGISGNILVVDDDKDVLYTARLALRDLFGKVDTLDRPEKIPEYLKLCRYDVILLDMNYTRGITSGKEGLEWLAKIQLIDPDVKVLTTTAYGEINLAVQAMKKGAVDFIIKPWNRMQLIASVRNVLLQNGKENEGKKNKTGLPVSTAGKRINDQVIISRSAVMARLKETIETIAATDANVLILGENGTGKELAARALHAGSGRRDKAFVHVDLGSVPETLFEAELFGHTRGAFTDAKEDRAGRFESASGGTLFLDEIGNLSMSLQAKILTAIQNREIVKIGSNHSVPINVRLISATNKPLYEMADSFEFRQDLLYRINTVEIVLPPLRERREDISLIADYYLKSFSEQYCKTGVKFDKDSLMKLEEYHWPGNIRELAHSIERAVILCKKDTLTPDDFMLRAKPFIHSPELIEEQSIRIEDYEKKAISSALQKYNGNLTKAAAEIGIARSTLYRKIAHLGIGNF
jgi:two-component system response regulator HydG